MTNAQIKAESNIVKIDNYEVNADDSRSFSSRRKRDVLDVAASYRKGGLRPHVYAVGTDADGRAATHRIA